jgi:signal transduction histidine kinase
MMRKKKLADMSQIRSDGSCGERDAGRFDIDLVAMKVEATELSPAITRWLLDTIPNHPTAGYLEHWKIGTLARDLDGGPVLISYAVRIEDDRPVRAIGFVAADALPFVIGEVKKYVPPPAELGAHGRITDYFTVAYAVPDHPRDGLGRGYYPTHRPVDPEFAGILLSVGLNDAGLNRLAPTGVPRQRGWEFLGLFTLAVGLVASSLLLLRQHERLATTRANFVSGISHELRTPLAQIRLFAEMLLLGRVRTEGDRRRSLEIIDTEARRLSQLVENVLQVARSERGHLHVNPISMRVAPVIRECVETFAVLGEARSMEFRMELEEDLVVPVDSAALRQVVLNLLDNAAKYGPDGQRVVVGLAMFDNNARIWVDDEGNGIPVRERERVFNPFYRTRDVQHTPGSGIGLAVVRELVALHGGDAWIEDAPDAGARLIVQFPGAQLAGAEAGDFAVA